MTTEILNKLQLDKSKSVLVLDKPHDMHLLDALNPDTVIKKKKYDTIFSFVFTLEEFVNRLQMVIDKDLLNADGSLFFIYPKKGNKKYKEYVGRDEFFLRVEIDDDGYIIGSLMKFYKMLSFNETFTLIGLKNEKERR